MIQQLSLTFFLIQWHNCHLYSPSYNETIVTYILPHTMTKLSLIFSLIQWHNCHLYSASYNPTICNYQLVIYTWQFHSSWSSIQQHCIPYQSPPKHLQCLAVPPSSNTVFPIKAPKHLQCLAILHSALQNTHRYSQLAVELPRYSQKALSTQLQCRPRLVFWRICHRISCSTSHYLRALSMDPAPRHTSGT